MTNPTFNRLLQNITYDADAPHIGAEADTVVGNDLGRHEFWRAEQNAQLGVGIEASGEAKVNYFDAMALLGQTEYIFGLNKIKLYIKL